MKEDLKRYLVNKLGGKCIVCGYHRCLAALDFHHLNPQDKKFNISSKSNLYDIQDELDKCVLLCNRCHKEHHNGLIDSELLLTLAGLD